MSDKKYKRQCVRGGFMALLAVIIISFALLTLLVGTGAGGFFARSSVLSAEAKRASHALAEACLNMALIKYIQDDAYGGNEDISVGSEICRVHGLAVSGSEVRITAGGEHQSATTLLTARFDISDPASPTTECRREVVDPASTVCNP